MPMKNGGLSAMTKTALITGASSGIGREIAKNLSKRGFKVILCARREDKLTELASELKTESRIIICDLSRREECFRLYEEVKGEKISVLINNAGFGKVGTFADIPLDTELKMIDTNITAVHILTKLFLKDFINADRGYIMNVASSAGLMNGGPLMAAYYATKAYVVDLTCAISQELKDAGSKVHICALCPGPVDTEFNSVADCRFTVKAISAKYCSDKAVDGMFAKKALIIPENTIKAMYTASRLLPRSLVLKVTGKIQQKKTEQ